MTTTIDRMAHMLELLARDVLHTLKDVPEDVLNAEVEVPEANSLFAIATHLLASSRVWTQVAIAGEAFDRDRDSEFVATGTFEELSASYETWIAAMHAALDGMPDRELDRETGFEPYRPDLLAAEPETGSMTVAHCLGHCMDHIAIHLGHIQVTRDALLAGGIEAD
jgi:uncharacterized damage-inducible protein DinB